MQMHHRKLAGIGAALVAGTVVSSACAQSLTYQPVILSGQQAPGLPAGVTLDVAGGLGYTPVPAVNDSSSVLFVALLSGPGVTADNDHSFWLRESDGTLRMIAREGTALDGIDGAYSFVTRAILNEANQVCFRGGIVNTTTSSDSIWVWDPNSGASIVASAGEEAPEVQEDLYFASLASNSYGTLSFTDAGAVSFRASLNGPDASTLWPGNKVGAWSRLPGQPSSKIYRTSEQAVGLPASYTFGGSAPVVMNNIGMSAFAMPAYATPGTGLHGVWAWDEATGLSLIAQDGDPLPGLTSNFVLDSFGNVVLSDSGKIAVGVNVGHASTGLPANITGIWAGSAAGLDQLVVHRGQSIPGTIPGDTFGDVGWPIMNTHGDIAFVSEIFGSGSNDSNFGVFIAKNNSLPQIVAQKGSPTPGIDGEVFHFDLSAPASVAISDSGQVAFSAEYGVVNPPWNQQFDTGLWMTAPSGSLHLVAAPGQVIDVNPDPQVEDLRTVESVKDVVAGPGTDAGNGSSFNARGELVTVINFTDGSSGTFIISVDRTCPADTNNDGSLTPADFTAWINAFNNNDLECDQNGDENCTATDFTAWIANYNAGC